MDGVLIWMTVRFLIAGLAAAFKLISLALTSDEDSADHTSYPSIFGSLSIKAGMRPSHVSYHQQLITWSSFRQEAITESVIFG